MDQAVEQARRDIAFMRAVAEDRGPLPAILGWHLVAIGTIWGLDFIHIWAIFTGLAPWPQALRPLPWLPALIVYAPINFWLNRRGRGAGFGPSARLFGACWAAMALMIPPAVLVLILGGMQIGLPLYRIWPAFAFILYGGAWMVIALTRRGWGVAGIGLGCFATALLCAVMIDQDGQWLVMALGLWLFVALPGALIVRRSAGGR